MSVDACVGAPAAVSNESDRMPTVSPEPSTPFAARVAATFMSESASEIVGAHTALGVAASPVDALAGVPVRGASTSLAYVTSGSSAIAPRAPGGASTVTVP